MKIAINEQSKNRVNGDTTKVLAFLKTSPRFASQFLLLLQGQSWFLTRESRISQRMSALEAKIYFILPCLTVIGSERIRKRRTSLLCMPLPFDNLWICSLRMQTDVFVAVSVLVGYCIILQCRMPNRPGFE